MGFRISVSLRYEHEGTHVGFFNRAETQPFTAAPDKNGKRLRFGVTWAGYGDVAGGVVARTHGLNAELLTNDVDNTDIYRIMYATLFGVLLPRYTELK